MVPRSLAAKGEQVMTAPPLGPLRARLAGPGDDRAAALALRRACFPADRPDRHDPSSLHLTVEAGGRAVAGLRMRLHVDGASVQDGYAAESYGLAAMIRHPGPYAEVGRLCVDPSVRGGPDVLRVLIGALAKWVEDTGARALFGCASFAGTDPAPHRDAFALLRHHVAPAAWRPEPVAPEAVVLPVDPVAATDGLRAMPPLLRFYLALGAWTSDHAVVDRGLDTMHVLVILDVARIRPGRLRSLRLC